MVPPGNPQTLLINSTHRYRVDHVEEGGMARVLFLSRMTEASPFDQTHRSRLAAKTLKRGSSEDASLFERELNIWAELRASHMAELIMATRISGRPFGLMPVFDCNLRDFRESQEGLSIEQVQPVALSILKCLHEAFRKHKVLHLDIKPENVLVDMSAKTVAGLFHVTDWGISRVIERRYLTGRRTNGLPADCYRDLGAGTICYMSPERILGAPTSVQADIYSTTMLVLEMASGILPFAESTEMPVEVQIISGGFYAAALSVADRLGSPRLSEFVRLGLHPDPRQRLSSHKKAMRMIARLQ